ncbi:MAG: iron-sulfur cluster repair di-iron protein [Capnocytophaga sp.]|nr:iron-sulfur cluster repair di-iron protein [Capnocytophaga sp.]
MEAINPKTIGEYVADDFRTAAVFKKHKIDFCCRGGRVLQEVCNEKGIDYEVITEELAQASQKADSGIDFNVFPLDLLADYIEKTHHRYVKEKTPVLLQFLDKLCRVHGDRHPELFAINDHFKASATDLEEHFMKEEQILFPFIRSMVEAGISGEPLARPHFGTVENPVSIMMDDHDAEGERFRIIASLTDNYTPPADACNTYRVTYAMLQEFEDDLHKHIHLENNILFPKAIRLEKRFQEINI